MGKICNNSCIIWLLLSMVHKSLSDLLITSISLSNDTIAQTASYDFQIVRFGTSTTITQNSYLEISFPNEYADSSVTSCSVINWVGATSLTCTYSQLKLTVRNGFPSNTNLQQLSFRANGIKNPSAANVYSPFKIRLVYPNGTSQNGTSQYSVTITTAFANCSMVLNSGLVYGQGILTITYRSQYIANGTGYTMKLSMLQSYPNDPTGTDVNPVLSVFNTKISKYLFQFPFTSTFNITMIMPLSTQPQNNFIFIMTSNILGDYDKCYVSIQGVQPNKFSSLSLSSAQVQSLSNLQITMLYNTPILQTDLIRIDFSNTDFNLSQVFNYATFTKGVIGQKQVTISGSVLTVRSISSFIIVFQIAFTLNNLIFPLSTKPQSIKIYTQTENGYIRDSQVYTYTSTAGVLTSTTYTCLINQIGYTTSCTLAITLKNLIRNSSYIQIKYPTEFRIVNGYMECITSGANLNTVSGCYSYALTNTIRVTGMISTGSIQAGSTIQITMPTIPLPTKPATYSLTITTRTNQQYIIDGATTTFTTVPRVLLSSEIGIQLSQTVTDTITNLTVTLNLPLSLGVPYVFALYIPLLNVSNISVNGNLLQSVFNASTNILTISNVANTALIITGFKTYKSTSPITLNGSLMYNGSTYFYFTGYDISSQSPKAINVFNLSQSNQIVGTTFTATMLISDLQINDIIKIPTTFYALTQTSCSSNIVCQSGGIIKISVINNYASGITSFTFNLVNNGYISVSSFQLIVYDSTGVFLKQKTMVDIRTQVLNVLNITASQNNPYYTQSSTYTFNVSLTTYPPSSSLNNLLTVLIPTQYTIQEWSCIFGCVAPQPPATQNTLYFTFSSVNIKFSIKLVNPVSFLSSITMTSSSFGDMDYGTYLPLPACNSPCRSCDSTNISYCLTCYLWSSENKLRNGTCVSNCSSGQFYDNSSVSCKACHQYCLSCVNTSTNCYTCKSAYYYFELKCLIQCPATYFQTTNGQCGKCSSNCLACTSETSCSSCQNTTYLYLSSCWASCQQGTYINPVANQCLNCSSFCTTCDATGCSQCQSSYFLYNKLCYLNCPTGLYKATNTCQPCQSPCRSCSVSSANCTSCVVNISQTYYYYLDNRCYESSCPSTYYVSPLDNTCLKCQNPCLTCNNTHCLTCQPNLYLYLGYCSSQCQIGTYPNANLTCSKCVSPCSTCSAANVCLSCQSPYYLYNSICLLSCPDKFYQTQRVCLACQVPCLTCSSLTTCKSCTTLLYFNGTCLSVCPTGFYSNQTQFLDTTIRNCLQCISPCVTCSSSTSCLSCISNLRLFNNSCIQNCPSGYYNSNGICFICNYPCKTCNSTGCLTCADNTTLYLQYQSCKTNCSILHPNNVTLLCEECKYPCVTCTWSNQCLSCADPFIFYQDECIQTCPSGFYMINKRCQACPNLCSTCLLYNNQIRCPTCVRGNYFYGYDCVAACPDNTTLQSPYCLSSSCQTLTDCQTCSNLRCLQCKTNFTLNQNTSKCQPIQVQGSVISSVSQIPVPFPFLIGTVLIIISAFLIRIQFNKMFAPLFIYAFVGITEFGVIALWLILIYIKGVNKQQSGNLLKIAATFIAGVYVCFNLLGFILHLAITRKDIKYRTWQKQDNKSTSIVVTIVSLIFSFRFSILKYSKLGHLLKFSAVLSHDSKLSHQNLIGFLSILLISIPMIVISAWIAYLQVSMNYLFFTCIQAATLSVIMIVLTIIQSLSPKGYTLEKRQQFKHGQDSDAIDNHSLSQMMIKMGIVQQQYHQGKQIISEAEVGAKNIQDQTEQGNKTTQAFMFPKHQDQKLSFQSDIIQRQQQQQQEQIQMQRALQERKNAQARQQLQKILMQAQERAQKLNRPSRPVGTIRKQTLAQLQYQQDSSEGIQSQDDEPPPIDTVQKNGVPHHKRENSLKRQQILDLNQLKNFLDVQQRRIGMKKLEQLFQILKRQQKQQEQLKNRLQRINTQQNKLKQEQYEKAKQIIQRNQMYVEQKLSKVQQMMLARNQNEKKRKQKLSQLEKKRKQIRMINKAEQSLKKNIIYPINQQINQSGTGQKDLNKQQALIPKIVQKQFKQPAWNEQQVETSFKQNKQWRMGSQRLSPSLVKENQIKVKVEFTEPLQQFLQDQTQSHWPLDPEIEQKITQVEERANKYIKQPKPPKSLVEEYDIQLNSDVGTGAEDILYKQSDQNAFNQDEIQTMNQKEALFQLNSHQKIPKRRVNRSVINLSPKKESK